MIDSIKGISGAQETAASLLACIYLVGKQELLMEKFRHLGVNSTKYGIITISQARVRSGHSIKIAVNSTGDVTLVCIGASKDVMGQHLLVGGAMTVEIVDQRLGLIGMNACKDSVKLIDDIKTKQATTHLHTAREAVGVIQQAVKDYQRRIGIHIT